MKGKKSSLIFLVCIMLIVLVTMRISIPSSTAVSSVDVERASVRDNTHRLTGEAETSAISQRGFDFVGYADSILYDQFYPSFAIEQTTPISRTVYLPAFFRNYVEISNAVHMGGNWGMNVEASNTFSPDYFEFLHNLNVRWVGVSVALHFDDSMDSTVDRKYSDVGIPTFSDEFLTGIIRALRQNGFNVYLSLAFESWEADTAEHPVHRWQLGGPNIAISDPDIQPEFWPWSPDHPDHQRFVQEFWQTYTEQAVHFGQIAEAEGVQMYSLGTETERLFRTRSGGDFQNDFGDELQSMVTAVRSVYSNLLTYDMLYAALVDPLLGPGSDYLWEDLGLDVVGISAYFPMVSTIPDAVLDVQTLEKNWEQIFNDYLIPLKHNNPALPIVFLEFGYVNAVESPYKPNYDEFEPWVFEDANGNGLDDGQENQANIYEAFFNENDRNHGLIEAAFLWGHDMASDEVWANGFATVVHFAVRKKLAEEVVRSSYAR